MLFMLTACTDKTSNNTDIGEAKTYTAIVEAPSNWTKNTTDTYFLMRYDFRSESGLFASFWIRPVKTYGTIEDTIKSYKETES